MPKITFIEPNGAERTVEAEVGQSVMQAAVSNAVNGIFADCGGCCACATCQVEADPAWRDKLAPMEEGERSMLEGVAPADAPRRLSCQVVFQADMDGIVFRIPESQY
jgi:ferredoxin, 2Fe-2S